MKIATLTDEKGNASSFGEAGIVKLYESNENGWQCFREIAFNSETAMNLSDVRQCISGLVSQLEDCKILVMKRAAGIFNVIFEEELGIKIWTITGSPVESLSQIEAQAKQIEAEPPVSSCHSCKSPSAEIIWPTPVDGIESGMFQINLVEVQQKNSSLNSQEILLPFLEGKKDFIELEIICMHVPKWLDRELETLNLELYTEDRKDEFCHVFLSRKS